LKRIHLTSHMRVLEKGLVDCDFFVLSIGWIRSSP
jgi:hypothetical protein